MTGATDPRAISRIPVAIFKCANSCAGEGGSCGDLRITSGCVVAICIGGIDQWAAGHRAVLRTTVA